MGVEPDRFNGILMIIAVVAVVTSLFVVGYTYFSVISLGNSISGHASGATANLSVESYISVNFTTDSISWGSGKVNDGQTYAVLTTLEANNVTNGNWTLTVGGGLKLQNDGNNNLTLNLSGSKTAAQFIGGTSPNYEWNISNAEANSCVNATGGLVSLDLDTFHAVNNTVGTGLACPIFQFGSSNDLIRIDFNITVPENSLTGALTDTITATAHV